MSTPTPANCSGLANSGVPANAPGDEIPASEADSSTVFARPRSIILAVTPPPSFNLTMMFVGLSLAKNADRTEFHSSRKLIAAARADPLGLSTHGPNLPRLRSALRKTHGSPG